ncbi:MAG: response regulator [Bacteroidia bacterium]|nr:response regulator [Bacteroidia bacterium]
MDKIKILVVEDESIVAKDIQNTLVNLGYEVPATASSAETAFERLGEFRPDLVFLDIRLKGDIDGIQIAEKIKAEYRIPVIFLTSYVDKATLERAKITEPYGYLVKPFNESDLQTTVEMALYKFQKDSEVKDSGTVLAETLLTVDEPVFITDKDWNLSFMNAKAEELTKKKNKDLQGTDLFEFIGLKNGSGSTFTRDEINSKLESKDIWESSDISLEVSNKKTGNTFSMNCSVIRNETNQPIGNAIVLRPADSSGGGASTLENQIIHDSFFVKKNSLLIKVYLDNILWIQAMDNYIIIQTPNDQFVVHSTMKDTEARLPDNKFIRVHRSYIISLDKVEVVDENTVLIKEKIIPIGKSYKDAFMKKLNFL